MSPAQLQSLLQQANAHHRAGRLSEAAAHYLRARTAEPKCFEAWHGGGQLALVAGRADEAEPLLARALALQPNATATAFCLGVARIARGDAAGAESVLRRLVETDPRNAEAWHYLALAHKTAGRFEAALEARRRAVELKPDFADGWCELGVLLSQTRGGLGESLGAFDRALQLQPAHARARLGRATVLFKSHRVAEAAGAFAAVVAGDPRQLAARSFHLMALNALPGRDREQDFAAHRAFGLAVEQGISTDSRPESGTPDPERRLRVAFLSPDLREHSVAYFIEPLLQHLDREAFEVFLYHDHETVDATSTRLRALAACWRHFAGQTDALVERAIAADAPDILVDLTGHTGANRLALFARRLAPVQVTYLGYPNTTGLAAMDYRFVDAHTDPEPGADAFHTEQLVRFSSTAWAYSAPIDAPEPAPPPCVATGQVTFGSFNNFTKATDEMLRVWAQILASVPGSRLLIKAAGLDEAGVREHVLARLSAAGFADGQVELLGRTRNTAAHLELYARVDVALDMFPYHGTTTTCEALWMGVPVVTLAGDRHASRVGVSLLNAVGHPEWIATTPEEYIHLATELANDSARLADLRANLRGDMLTSSLLDHAGQAAQFGAALRECWRRHCAAAEPVAV